MNIVEVVQNFFFEESRKFKVIDFVENAGVNINAKTFILKSKEEVSLSEAFALCNWMSIMNMFIKDRYINDEYE